MAGELNLTFSLADYDRTRPLLTGQVTAEKINFQFRPAVPGEACMRPVYEEFDVAEMSLSWFAMARLRGEPVIAVPVSPMRMSVQRYIFCSASSNIHAPADLRGKKVGMDQYRLTVGLWTRGILQEFYGVNPGDMAWVASEPEGAGFAPPEDVRLAVGEKNVESLLLEGALDALIAPNVPPSFQRGDRRIRRLFPDARGEVMNYFRKTKIFPITHTVVIREALAAEHPWIVGSIVGAFAAAEKACRKAYAYPKRLALPAAVHVVEEEEAAFGKDPFAHGLTPENRLVLDKFLQYAQEQGYIARRPRAAEMFASAVN